MLTDRTCAWVAERALFSHFVFMYASPWPMELPLGLRRNIKHFAYRPMKLDHGSSHVLNLTAIRRQLLYITTIHIVIPQKAERDLHGITTDDRILMHIALLFLMRYRVAIVGQAEQDGHGDIQSGMTLRPVRHALSGVKGYRHLNMFYHPHGQAVRNSIIEFSRTDVLWTREEDLGLLEDRKPVVSRLANMVPMLRMRCYLSLASACSGI
ncbi:hypothetical protein BDV27DRAFT_146390 [Aspergillus caelatus]|uniref:Uncharacterized protein n=1 Tax=Aspergillus caelatus TaxID=61420 RepID=A0A5N7A3K1_9EURO|nr:uncharacterized protein BDV27DRAFT_146390 [Aspergillus caelatus]KAE8363080.1 hypothetical protein BDV27DRAFT_146390 [Aspergillus caelatus]